jgi:quercetin dioxygenase-like cupin family protein
MIDAREFTHRMATSGHAISQGFDEPGAEYPPHAHERTILYTVSGSLRLHRDGQETVTLSPGDEAVIEEGQEHSGKVGPRGWKYVAATALNGISLDDVN